MAGVKQEPAAPVVASLDGVVATITINRARVRNALDIHAWRELRACLDQVAADFPAVRVVVLRGAGGKAFVAGADLRELAEIAANPDRHHDYVELIESVMTRLETLPQPVIAAIEGPAVGAGLELMAACDLRVARAGSRMGIPAAKLGLAITGQDLHRLERLVGIGRVKWLLLTGKLVTAEKATSWGLVDAVYPESDFETELMALAAEIGSNSSLTHELTKRALATYTNPVEQGAEAGFACSLPAWSSPSLAEGLAAFTEGRPPDFLSVESRAHP